MRNQELVRRWERSHDAGWKILNDQPRTCVDIHQQIRGFVKYANPGKTFECGKCHKLFLVTVH